MQTANRASSGEPTWPRPRRRAPWLRPAWSRC